MHSSLPEGEGRSAPPSSPAHLSQSRRGDLTCSPAHGAPGTPVRPVTLLSALGLIALCLAVYLPGFFALPPVDRDEARFAQASRQMLESVALPAEQHDPALHSGGLIVPRLQGRDRLNKPPLIYWLQAISAAVFTLGRPLIDAIWMYRVPSVLAAIVTVLLTWRLGTSLFDSRTGRLAAALLACCPIVAWEARQARADMVLLALNTATMFALWRIWSSHQSTSAFASPHHVAESPGRPFTPSPPYSAEAPEGHRSVATGDEAAAAVEEPVEDVRKGNGAPDGAKVGAPRGPAILFWSAIALAILTKGPTTPLIAALTALSLSIVSRRWRWLLALRFELGIPLLLAITLPWVIAVGERVGWAAYLSTIADESLGRVAASRESHWGPPGYYTLLLPVLFWPGSLMTAAGIALALRQGLTSLPTPARGTGVPPVATPSTPSSPRIFARAFTRLRSLQPRHAPYFFCLAWTLPAWLVFELIATKLPHYTLPMYPAIAILSSRAVLAAEARLLPAARERARRLGAAVWLFIGVILALGMLALTAYARQTLIEGSSVADLFVGLLAIAATSLAVWNLALARRAIRAGRWLRAQLAGLFAFMVTWIVLAGCAIPPAINLSRDLIRAINVNDPHRRRPVAAVGYHEDSLEFLTRARLDRISAAEVDGWLKANSDGLVVMPLSSREAPPGLRVVGGADGFNYSKGRYLRLGVLQRAP